MKFYRYLLLLAVCLFCLTCLVACQNNAPADQLTVVQGTVTSADTGRPLPGVLMAVESYQAGAFGPTIYRLTGDSVRTDASGQYQLKFTNKKGLYYVVSFDPITTLSNRSSKFVFGAVTAQSSPVGPDGHPNLRSLVLGSTNKVDFKPNELRTVAVRIRNRNTGYQRLYWQYGYFRGNNLDTLAYLINFYPSATAGKFSYYNVNAAGPIGKDTSVALVFQNPTALLPDTLRATLTFVR
ncbi:MAG: hypothetical protein WKG07_34670 [Hymenobacter sp.]